jgi:hypothetical protein
LYQRPLLIGVPVGLLILFLIIVGPQFLNAIFSRNEIVASNLPQDLELIITLQPSIDDLDKNYFLFSANMKMGIAENSTRQLDYNIYVMPGPVTSTPSISGLSVPFSNLESEGEYTAFYSNGGFERFMQYSYDSNMSSIYVSREGILFPGDYYSSSVIYVWFNAPFYPDITLSPASSLPRGYIAYLSAPVFIKPTDYINKIEPFQRLFMPMPSNDVMAFQIIVQRDESSLTLYSVYTFILLFAVGEVLVLSHAKVNEMKDRLSIFVGLAIASVAFLWSVRQVTNVISLPEVVLIMMLGVSISFEVWQTAKDGEKKPVKTTAGKINSTQFKDNDDPSNMTQPSEIKKEHTTMLRPFWVHLTLFISAIAVSLAVPWLCPFQVTAVMSADSTRTLLALNGTLLALVVGFSTFYFAIMDTRRQEAVRRQEDTLADPLTNSLLKILVDNYRANMRAISILLIAISFTYAFFLLVTYGIYILVIQISGNLPTGLATYGFSVSLASPVVTVGDAVIMTWFLTRDVAGRSMQEQLHATEVPVESP